MLKALRYLTGNFSLLIILLVLNVGCSSSRNETTIEKGNRIAQESFKALSGQLQQAMKVGGIEHAIRYCNANANPIIDSLSRVYAVEIRRTTFHARNKANLPTDLEEEFLIDFHKTHKLGEKIEPALHRDNDGAEYYFAPIVIPNALCLTCHGDPGSSMSNKNYVFIRSIYPTDDAVGYKEGDLRGMWSIKFNK